MPAKIPWLVPRDLDFEFHQQWGPRHPNPTRTRTLTRTRTRTLSLAGAGALFAAGLATLRALAPALAEVAG